MRAKEIVNRWPEMIGKYEPRKQAAAVVFVKNAVSVPIVFPGKH